MPLPALAIAAIVVVGQYSGLVGQVGTIIGGVGSAIIGIDKTISATIDIKKIFQPIKPAAISPTKKKKVATK